MNRTGYYGIVATKRDGRDVWVTYPLRDARAAERFYHRPPEGRLISVGYRLAFEPIVSGWTLHSTGVNAVLHVHGVYEHLMVPRWVRHAANPASAIRRAMGRARVRRNRNL